MSTIADCRLSTFCLGLAFSLLAVPVPEASGQPVAYESWSMSGHEQTLMLADTLDASAPPDRWLGRDKALHAGGSFLLTLSGQYVLTAKLGADEGTALPIAAGSALALGLLKEVLDSQRARHPHFSTRDLVADAVGILLAAGLIVL